MDPTYSAEAEAYREQIRAFLAEHLPNDWQGVAKLPESERAGFVDEWRLILGRHGFVAPAWPKEYGGGGLSAMERVVLHEEFAKADVPVGGPNDAFNINMIGPTLMLFGTEEQKQRFLPRILSGEDRWAQGYSEPGSGSDLASLSTRAVLDGDEWVINGQKIWTSEGHTANWIFVVCRTDPTAPKNRGISFLLVPMDQPGVELRPIINMAASHDFNEVFFTDARTAAENIVGGVNDGWRVTTQLLAFERGDDATTISLRVKTHLDRMVEVARRKGRLADPIVRQHIASAYSRVEILRYLGMRTLTRVLKDDVLGPESSMNKILWSELYQVITNLTIDLYGADALVPDGERPLNVLFSDASGDPLTTRAVMMHFFGSRPASVYSGSNQIQRNILGERVLGLPREPQTDGGPWNQLRR